ncbi:MAG TPA: DeoR/GlpR transcriptional regulator [Clostridiaceae bacterium]|nr:DeoR/GlpR transcriptional regulator [Clostridiaceae bacterium]
MLVSERRQRIIDILREKKSVTVTELRNEFGVSEETIRRDLLQLEQDKMLNRVYGGAYLGNIVQQTLPITLRKETCRDAKEIIADICGEMIDNGDTIMLDTSTTAYYIAKTLKKRRNVTVITNSLDTAHFLSSLDSINLICAGGRLIGEFQAFLDNSALKFMEGFYADKAFVSCTGISIQNGLTDSVVEQGNIRRVMLKNAQQRICIADDTKLGKTTLARIVPLDAIDCLVTNVRPSEVWLNELNSRKISCLYPES